MSLFAFNKTGAPLPLAAGHPIVTLPASPVPPSRSKAYNVTAELCPNLTVDPVNGKAGGLTAAEFALLQAQQALGSTTFEWDGPPEFLTASLVVSGSAANIPTANEKAALAGYGTPSAANPYLTADMSRRYSQGDKIFYVDKALGNDANDGSVGAPWQTLMRGLDELQKFIWLHNCTLRVVGTDVAHDLPWDYPTYVRGEKGIRILVDGGPDETVIAAAVACDIGGVDGRTVGNSGLALTPNDHRGAQLKITSGALAGEKSTIIGNTATTYRLAQALSGDPTGMNFEIVKPKATLTVDGAYLPDPAVFDQQVNGGIWSVEGHTNLRIQRFTFTGNIPVTLLNEEKASLFLSSCVFDKEQIPTFSNFWRYTFVWANGAHGCDATVLDPAVAGGGLPLPLNKCGVGSLGGDGSVYFWDVLNEWDTGYFYFIGSVCQRLAENAVTGHGLGIDGNSHICLLEGGETLIDSALLIQNCSFGGFITPFLYVNIDAGIQFENSSISIGSNVDISNSLHGIKGQRFKMRLEGAISGVNTLCGICLTDGSTIYYQFAAPPVTVTGPLGDFSLDGSVAYPGGHAAVQAGAVARDVVQGCVARLQPRRLVV